MEAIAFAPRRTNPTGNLSDFAGQEGAVEVVPRVRPPVRGFGESRPLVEATATSPFVTVIR